MLKKICVCEKKYLTLWCEKMGMFLGFRCSFLGLLFGFACEFLGCFRVSFLGLFNC